MRNKILFAVTAIASVLLLCISSSAQPVISAQPEIAFEGKSLAEYAAVENSPVIEAKYAYVMNLDTGYVVYGKDFNIKTSPANTVKLMTAITAYENIPDLDVEIQVSQHAVSTAQGSNMALEAGQKFTARTLLYGLLVRGANDAALVLAEYVAGSEEEFCVLMNERAKQLGANDTHFENVTGFYTPGSFTTARDMGIIAQHMYYIPELFDMSDTARYYVVPVGDEDGGYYITNRNFLLSKMLSDKYYDPRAKGMTLGSTPEGGNCVVSTYTSDKGLTYLCVVLGSREDEENNYACVDIKQLFEFCKDSFAFRYVTDTGKVMCEIPLENANDVDHLALFPEREVEVLLPVNMDISKDISVERRIFKETAYAPINKGDVFGEIVVRYKDEAVIATVNLVSNVKIDRSNVLYFFSKIENTVTSKGFIVFVVTAAILFALYFGLSVYYRYFKRNKYTGNRVNRK